MSTQSTITHHCLAAVTRMAEPLQVAAYPEARWLSVVWLDVIHLGCRLYLAILQAMHTARLIEQDSPA